MELFLVSAFVLFLELALLRWIPAHVLYLTYFTNTVLLASFLGLSAGLLASRRRPDMLRATPALLLVLLVMGRAVESVKLPLARWLDVGSQAYPQLVFFATEHFVRDAARFLIPIELLCGLFFLLTAVVFVGPGQRLGRALQSSPDRLRAYTLNILGSMAGVAAFGAASWLELPPLAWFLGAAAGLALLLRPLRPAVVAGLAGVLGLAAMDSGSAWESGRIVGSHLWSPYYRVDYRPAPARSIAVNLLGHQQMSSHESGLSIYALPHLFQRDAGQPPFQDVLVVGAGSGNDVSRALQWGARKVDAVEIDPVIARLGMEDHPDHPYQDSRVTLHIDDGRNFLHSTSSTFDLIVYGVVDSLILHSSQSNIRLESFLFTREAFADARRRLKPGGVFALYNYYRQGWIVGRLTRTLREVFGQEPLVLPLPHRDRIGPESSGGFTLILAGNTEPLRGFLASHPDYRLRAGGGSPSEERVEPARVDVPEDLRPATDDWPLLYLRRPMIPGLGVRGMAVMAAVGAGLLWFFRPRGGGPSWDARMFFLGAGFMLLETKAVVHLALLFGSTWIVNSLAFFAILAMALLSNLWVARAGPPRLGPAYAGLFAALAANVLVPLDLFLGLGRAAQAAAAGLLLFSPVFFSGVIFSAAFARSRNPDRDLGSNVAGALAGGLTEYASMLLGFRRLMLVAMLFYGLSAWERRTA